MRLLFVTPELTPYSDRTPTGDACAALPKALRGRGHEVTVVSPLYGFIDPQARGLGRRLRKIEPTVEGKALPFTLYDARTAAGVDLQFLGNEELLAGCEDTPVLDDDPDNARRYLAFSKAVVELIASDEDGFDAVQCHDWCAALVPTLLKEAGNDVPTVLAFGEADREGRFESEIEKRLGVDHGYLEAGVRDASRVVTVSPTHAAALVEPGTSPLGPMLAARGRDFSGIVGGIDVATWNPATDAHLETRFDPMDLSGKRRCKASLQRDLELPVRDDVPLVAVLGFLDASTGLDVLPRIMARVLRNDVQVVVVAEDGSDPELAQVLNEHAERWPDRFAVDDEGERTDVHRTLSAADLVMLEPQMAAGGLNQLRAQRYGALPIGPRRGAVADTVVDCDAKLTTGTGFLFDGDDDDTVLAAIQRACAAYSDRPAFERLRFGVLAAEHGWDRAAYLYERLYESLG